MEFKDYYQILGVSQDASQDEIKRAFRRLARKYHPDVSKEAEAEVRFKEVNEANEVLKDPEKRAAYDELGAHWKAGQDFQPPPEWNQGFEFHEYGTHGSGTAHFSDFFESLFGSGFSNKQEGTPRRTHFHMHGEDTHARVFIDLEDAYHGATRAFLLKHTQLGPDGRPHVIDRTLNVHIPKGVTEGQMIRLTGQGGAGIGRGSAGDLYLEMAFKPHEHYRVEGRDVYLRLPAAPWEMALGASVQAPTPDGRVELKIPPNSAGGRHLRLKGKGIPGAPPGDLYIVLEITLPPADSDAARAAYRACAQAMPFDPRAHLMGVRT